jgi:hypothetical protein
VLGQSRRLFDLRDADFVTRLSAVHRARTCCSTRATTVPPPSRPCGPSCATRRFAW